MINYFTECETLEELKKEFYKLALKFHPDHGGNLEDMKALNTQYDNAFDRLKNFHKNKDGEIYTKDTGEKPSEFRDIIDRLITVPGIVVEVIGSFVWVSGDTKPIKEKLKGLGFKWSRKKVMWYKSPAGYRRYGGKKEYDMDEIRNMYGVQYRGTGSARTQIEA